MNFLIDLEDTIDDKSPGGASELAYLNALATRQYDADADTTVLYLDNAFMLFRKEFETMPIRYI